jgi:hypothetical protein
MSDRVALVTSPTNSPLSIENVFGPIEGENIPINGSQQASTLEEVGLNLLTVNGNSYPEGEQHILFEFQTKGGFKFHGGQNNFDYYILWLKMDEAHPDPSTYFFKLKDTDVTTLQPAPTELFNVEIHIWLYDTHGTIVKGRKLKFKHHHMGGGRSPF